MWKSSSTNHVILLSGCSDNKAFCTLLIIRDQKVFWKRKSLHTDYFCVLDPPVDPLPIPLSPLSQNSDTAVIVSSLWLIVMEDAMFTETLTSSSESESESPLPFSDTSV